ncbi:hypothetical protein MBLNU457_4488t2 [Dothideomycetes sp. NU457]
MTSRRIPLANNPNAANSPFRAVPSVAGKRTRAQSNDPKELISGQPPSKKQILELDNDENVGPRQFTRQSQIEKEAESRVFTRKPSNAPMTTLEKRLLASREKKLGQPMQIDKSPDKSRRPGDGLENIRQWQRHYKKAFPSFVFYFESVPDDVRRKMSQQVQMLGAKEEKFFSRSVTHVVTTRSIPPEHATNSPEDGYSAQVKTEHGSRTIDPSLLGRAQDSQANAAQKRTTDLLDATLQARAHHAAFQVSQHMDPRRAGTQTADILTKARELNIKIWALEKLARMMSTMFNMDTGEQPHATTLTRSHATTNLAEKQGKDADLQRLLRNEKLTGPAEAVVSQKKMIQLRGYYIYVHDMDEQTRPVMIRDYDKVAEKEQGKWPQFRISAPGRCPFIEDHSHQKRLAMEEQQKAAEAAAPRIRTRSAVAALGGDGTRNGALAEVQPNVRRSPRKVAQDSLAKPLDPPKMPVSRHHSADGMPALFGSAQATLRNMKPFIGREPVASGVQPSNITSAIRSQIISSTAISSTAPGGGRVGTSKEIHALKRKVLERGASVTSGQTLTSSYMNDVRAALNGDGAPPPRAAKRKAQETLGGINEEPETEHEAKSRKISQSRKKVVVTQKDPKPGYCENCRDKFDDFDEHILSRKHRKFALANENWTQLDALLGQLARPLKDE